MTSEDQVIIRKFWQRFDIVALSVILIISLLIGLVLWRGEPKPLSVSNFSWEGKQVGTQDSDFTLTFNRPVNREKIEKNLAINPPLPGKISWSGRNLFYTLTEVPIYGTTYQIKLEDAIELQGKQAQTAFEPFMGIFKTRDLAFAYIGVEKQQQGRLILYNIPQRKPTILTPVDLVVTDFAIYPDASRLLFSAFTRNDQGQKSPPKQLYTVTTGLNFAAPEKTQPVGRINLILDSKSYQNLQFNLSTNGQTIVVQRENRRNPAESGLWVIPEGGEPRPLGIRTEEFMISPEGQTVAVTQAEGVILIPLTPEAGSAQLFPGYGKILAFSPDSSEQLMVKYNPDYTQSLVLVSQKGTAKELSRTLGPIVGCKFEPRKQQTLYCIKTDLVEEEGQYWEEPFLAAIDLKTGKNEPLLALPNYRDVQISISPDGLALLFDQVVTTTPGSNEQLRTQENQAIATGRLWLLPLSDVPTEDEPTRRLPESLFPGFHPRWLP